MAKNPVVTLYDDSGLPLRTSANPDGTASLSPAQATALITLASAAQVSANTGTSFSTAAVGSLAVDVTVSAFTGGSSPSVTFFVDRQGADGVWYRVWTSSAINSAGATSVSIGPGLTGTGTAAAVLTSGARFGWSYGGSPTSVTFSASVVGR